MAKRGSQPGNQNASKGREWLEAIRYALANFEDDTIKRGKALKAIAWKVVAKAIEGDKEAYQEIANRLDGKPGQIIDATIHHDVPKLSYEEIKVQLIKEHGESAAQLLLGEITPEEYHSLLKQPAIEIPGNETQH